MMDRLVECVPNFSEGRDQAVIEQIAKEAEATGVKILTLEPDSDYNRTVLTFVGDPETVSEGAFAVIRSAKKLINMEKHQGGHPRMGACDVTPFVPVANTTLEDCAKLAQELGKRVADELGLTVYLYGAAAREGRKDLAKVRKGQYEGLCDKLKDPEWAPDFGPAVFDPQFGAALIGARPFLIAYNVNLQSNNVDAANTIAKTIRTSGYKVDGKRIPGTLPCVKGLGVLLKDKNIAQVSMNLTDYNKTNMHKAFEEVRITGDRMKQCVTGSEIVGVVPLEAIVQSGEFYAGRKCETEEAVEIAVEKLGLADLEPFDPKKKILEWML